jgi:uncharacterized membrane protein YhaH (DUF805 family)
MRIRSQQDFWSGLVCLIAGVAFAVGATNYTFGNSAQPGPGYFPLCLGVILALLGAFIAFGAVTKSSDDGDMVGAIAWRPLIAIVGSVVVFGLLLPQLGLIVTLPLVVVTASSASNEFAWKASLMNAGVLTVTSWLIFVKGLGLAIPMLPAFAAAG